MLGRNSDIVISMSKAKKYGWTAYVDTWESSCQSFDDLEKEKEKVLPNCKVDLLGDSHFSYRGYHSFLAWYRESGCERLYVI